MKITETSRHETMTEAREEMKAAREAGLVATAPRYENGFWVVEVTSQWWA